MAARYFSLAIAPLFLHLLICLISMDADVAVAQRTGTQSSFNSPTGTLNQQSSGNSLSNRQSPFGQGRNAAGQQSATGPGSRPRGRGPQSRQLQEQGFVGRSAEDVRETFRNLNGRQRRRATFDMLIENLNEMRQSRKREQKNPAPPVHVNLRPTFDFPRRSTVEIATGMQVRLDKVMIERGVAGPQVALDGRTATLRGTVRTAHDRALVEKLVAIEPGVSQVENQLVIAE